jgi:hypothetical protein
MLLRYSPGHYSRRRGRPSPYTSVAAELSGLDRDCVVTVTEVATIDRAADDGLHRALAL